MTSYRYLFTNVVNGQVLAELPVTGVSFTQQLNSAGTLSGHILLSGMDASFNAAAATTPGQTAVYVDRNGVLLWGGIIWQRTYNSSSQELTITAQEFESYLGRRRISGTLFYSNKDQLLIASDLVAQAMATPYGNIGVNVPSISSGYIPPVLTYYAYQQKTFLSALQDLAKSGSGAANQSGFDFAIKVAYDGAGNIQKNLVLGYPMLGTRYSSTSTTAPVFEFPAGNVAEYEIQLDGSKVANTIYVTGYGTNEGMLTASASDTTKLVAGWPLLEDAANYRDVYDSTLLLNLAKGQVSAVSTPPQQLKLVVNPSEDPVLGAYSLGDDVRVRITDPYFPTGLDSTYRIVGITVTPGEAGPERVTLSLTLPTTF